MSKTIQIKESDFERLVSSVDGLTTAVKMLVDAQASWSYPAVVVNYEPYKLSPLTDAYRTK
jgi:hypothetical protein